MTKKKDLKKRVRARQEKTGESYTAALAQLRRVRIPEAPGATIEAQAAGFRCEAVVSSKLRALGDLRPLFTRLRELLEGLGAEACGPLLRGEQTPRRVPQVRDMIEARRFFMEVRTGKRGLGPDGRLVAFEWGGLTVLAAVSLIWRKPLLQVGLLDDVVDWMLPPMAFMGLGR